MRCGRQDARTCKRRNGRRRCEGVSAFSANKIIVIDFWCQAVEFGAEGLGLCRYGRVPSHGVESDPDSLIPGLTYTFLVFFECL